MNRDIISNRFKDLANMAYLKGIPVFTDFLDLKEQTKYIEFISDKNMPPVNTLLNGGVFFLGSDKNSSEIDFLERKMACFYPKDLPYEVSFPISIVEVKPLNSKFADDLNHRDFLGSLMNLGIERYLIGDILVKDNSAYVFVENKMADFICENLTKIKHTSVTARLCDKYDFDYTPSYKEEKGSVASERIDAVIAFAFNMSRNDAALLISAGKVFVNSQEIISKSHTLKYGDIVSVRGKGRFIFDEIVSTTKKGRYYIKIRKYI